MARSSVALVFGLENAHIQALFAMWFIATVSILVLSLSRIITSSAIVIMIYLMATLASTLILSFNAKCLSMHGYIYAALVSVVMGVVAILAGGLALR